MKRLYVRPKFRGKQISEQLVEKIIRDAKEIGYSFMLLDTLPFLKSAINLYKKYGFYEIPSYNNTSIYELCQNTRDSSTRRVLVVRGSEKIFFEIDK